MAAVGMTPQQARIPFIPDQTDFVNTWHDWHRGFRRLDLGNGTETFQHLTGQPLNEVSIGRLPLPADGSSPYDSRAIKWMVVPDVPVELFPSQQEVLVIPDEDRLFDSDEESSGQTTSNQISTHAISTREINDQASLATSTGPRGSNNLSHNLLHTRNLRSFLERLNSLGSLIVSTSVRLRQLVDLSQISSTEGNNLREEIEELMNMAEETARRASSLTFYQRLRINAIASGREINLYTDHRTSNQTNTTTEPIPSRQNRTAAVTERIATVFGTREEVQQADYESPLTLMFNRQHAWRARMDRLHQEEEERYIILSALRRHIIRRMRPSLPPPERISSPPPPIRNLSTGNEVDEQGQPLPSDNTSPLQINDTDMDTFLDPVRRLVLSQLREHLPFPEWISRLTYEHRLTGIISEYTKGLAETLSTGHRSSSPLPDEYESEAIQDLIQKLLECIYPRQPGESLRNYIARIGLENTRRVEQNHQAMANVGGDMNTTTQFPPQRHRPFQTPATFRSLQPPPDRLEPPSRPLASSETMVQLQCIACREQIANIALVPCGHMLMCRWCSEQHALVRDDQGRRLGTTCPMCRQKIKQRLRIWGLDGDKEEGGRPTQEGGMEDGNGDSGGNVVHAA